MTEKNWYFPAFCNQVSVWYYLVNQECDGPTNQLAAIKDCHYSRTCGAPWEKILKRLNRPWEKILTLQTRQLGQIVGEWNGIFSLHLRMMALFGVWCRCIKQKHIFISDSLLHWFRLFCSDTFKLWLHGCSGYVKNHHWFHNDPASEDNQFYFGVCVIKKYCCCSGNGPPTAGFWPFRPEFCFVVDIVVWFGI